MEGNIVYQHAFSIGDGCHIAAALSRTGLRENSGPFDWLIIDINDVMTLIDNHFEDFLNPDLLVPAPIPFNAGQRRHKRYKSLVFVHDFDPEENAPPLEEQIGAIQAKYQRRIDYFYNCIKEPTQFYMMPDNLDDWKKHYKEYDAFFKKFNPDNIVIYMEHDWIKPEDAEGYPIYIGGHYRDDHVLGYFVEDCKELSAFMHSAENFPLDRRCRNLRFFIDKQLGVNREISMNEMRIEKERNELRQYVWKHLAKAKINGVDLTAKLKADGITSVVIAGADAFGKAMYNELKGSGITVQFFAERWGKEPDIDGIPIHYHSHSEKTMRGKFLATGKTEEELPDGQWLWEIEDLDTAQAVILAKPDGAFRICERLDLYPMPIYTISALCGEEPVLHLPGKPKEKR